MTIKKAIAIGLLTTATLGLAIFGIKKGILKKPITQTNAENKVLIYQNNFTNTLNAGNWTYIDNVTFTFNGNFKYYQTYQNEIKYNFEIETTITGTYEKQGTTYNFNAYNTTPTDNIIYFTTDYANTSTDTFTFFFEGCNAIGGPDNITSVDFRFYINDVRTHKYLQTTNNQDFDDDIDVEENIYTETFTINEQNINQESYDQGYETGYSQGYQNGQENQITINTINYTNQKIEYTATATFQPQYLPRFTNNNTFSITAETTIEVKIKDYYNNLNILVNGYETKIGINIISITNTTTNQQITQQQQTTQAIIYSDSTPSILNIILTEIKQQQVVFQPTLSNENYLYAEQYARTNLNQQVTSQNTTPTTQVILTTYNLGNIINNLQPIIEDVEETAYQQGLTESGSTTEIIPLQDIMLNILTMPFTFISQAFNVTLWPGTKYAFNFANFIKGLIAISAILFIIKVFTSGFSIMGNFNTSINSKITNKRNISNAKATAKANKIKKESKE